MSGWLVPLTVVVIAAIGSGAVAIVAANYGARLSRGADEAHYRRERHGEARALAAGLAAEIDAIRGMDEALGFTERGRDLSRRANAGEAVSIQGFVLDDGSTSSEWFPIYWSRVRDLGLLEELTGPAAEFYATAINLWRNAMAFQRRFPDPQGVQGPIAVAIVDGMLAPYTAWRESGANLTPRLRRLSTQEFADEVPPSINAAVGLGRLWIVGFGCWLAYRAWTLWLACEGYAGSKLLCDRTSAQIAGTITPPVAVLIFGCAVLWAFCGFGAPRRP